MKSIAEGLDDINKDLREVETHVNAKKDLERIHKDNQFNRRFSNLLGAFSDLDAVGRRLEDNISKVEDLNRKIQARFKLEDKDQIMEEGQRLHRESDKINHQNQADFKSLYFFAKIFSDKYTALLRFLFNWRGIGDKSVTNFYNDLEKYKDDDPQVILFKEACLNRLRAIDIFITQYRDKYIANDQTGHKETKWFMTDMEGGVRFIGGRSSITPKDLIFVVSGYISDTAKFVQSNLY